jgi:hypothetical protein
MTKPRKRSGITKPARQSEPLPKDIAILHGPTEDGEGARMLRFKEGTLYAGEVRPVREGQSVEHSELVRLRPLDHDLPLCEVEVLHAPEARKAQTRPGNGPARFTTDGYRRNWGAVFGRDRDESWSLN